MDEGCITFNIGKINVTADQQTLNFSEHRKMCNKDGNLSFEYGTVIGKDEIFIVGHSIKPEGKLENYKFVIIVYINDKEIDQKEVTYADLVDLFTRELNSKMLSGIKSKYLPALPPSPAKLREPKKKTKVSPKLLEAPKSQKSQKVEGKESQTKIKLVPGKKEGYVVNPETGAEIKIGGKTYQELCKTGKYAC